MTYNEETKTLTASEGKVLRRIEDGNIYGESIALGYSYYIGGRKLEEPHLDVPSDFEEIDNPYKEDSAAPVTLDEAKEQLKKKIEDYDGSDNVNSFLVNGESAWMTNAERTSYTASVSNAETLNEGTVDLLLNGRVLTLPTASAKTMLAQISRYADKCWMVTQRHLMEAGKLESIEDALGYGYKAGYPERPSFEVRDYAL